MTDKAKESKATAKDEEKDETPNSVEEAAAKWPEGAPAAVQEYEAIRADQPEDQEGLTPKPE